MLERLNLKRKKVLDSVKTTKAKKRRLQLKSQRTYEAQQRKLWSNKHGHHTYGEEEEDTVEKVEIVEIVKGAKEKKKCKCGSSSHSLPTHRNCRNNPKNLKLAAISGATPIGNDNLADNRAITTPQVDDVDFADDEEEEDTVEKVEIVEIVKGAKEKKKCKCGSSSHSLPTHRNCRNNPKNLKLAANSGACNTDWQ